MADIVTDTHQLEITIIEHGNPQIKDVVYPDSVEANEDFTITYDVENTDEDDNCFGRVFDTVTGIEIANTRWDEIINEGSIVTKTATIPGSDVFITLTIEVGYVKA
jgi:hypothetical protein